MGSIDSVNSYDYTCVRRGGQPCPGDCEAPLMVRCTARPELEKQRKGVCLKINEIRYEQGILGECTMKKTKLRS